MTEQEFINALPTNAHIWGHWETRTIFVDDVQLPPEPSQKVRNHSPDGFNWGDGGSGSAQFALGLLLWYVDPETAQRYYQRFKFAWVGSLPQSDFDGVFDLRGIMRRKLSEEPGDPDTYTTKK